MSVLAESGKHSRRWGLGPYPMWTESYRPQTLDEVVGQEHITRRLRYIVEQVHNDGDGAFPHMMFAGPPGTGKTSTGIALMKTLFGDSWESNFMELNASDERSISVIRTKVRDFSSRGVIGSYEIQGRSVQIPFNVVFLDEADHLTPDAQAALRRVMERYAKQTRFILSCNYPHRIIPAIRDRCAFSTTRFRPISEKAILTAIDRVVSSEGLSVGSDAMAALATLSGGSMRSALNILYSASRIPGEVEVEDVQEVAIEMSPEKVRQLLALAIEASSLDDENPKWLKIHRRLDSIIEKLGSRGMSGPEIMEAFHRTVSDDQNVPINLRRAIYKHLGEATYWCAHSQDDLLPVKTFLRRVSI
jgi:replication factor C small subunit